MNHPASDNRDRVLNLVLLVVGACAVLVAGAALYRTVYGPPARVQEAARDLKNWQDLASVGWRLGPPNARVEIVEFSDFQCPFCRRSAADLKALREKYPADLAVIFRHYPLTQIHPDAEEAALAAECAGAQGRFEQFQLLAFERQSSLGSRDWRALGSAAGVGNLKTFGECVARREGMAAVDRDRATGDSLGILGTPTIIVQGKWITVLPTFAVIDSLLQLALLHR